MMQVFDLSTTKKTQLLVEYLTDTGSAFGVTPQGEQVFMNRRLVEKMNLVGGEVLDAFLLPNYPDKRETIPWRAMRVELPAPDPRLEALRGSIDDQVEALKAEIMDYMTEHPDEDGIAFHPKELSVCLEAELWMVERVLKSNPEVFRRVDAYVLQTSSNHDTDGQQ